MTKRIVSVGDLVLDIILPVQLPIQPAHHQDTGTRRVEPGGAGNFIIAARRMGLEVSAVGAVGADPFGGLILDLLHSEGVDTTYVTSLPGSTSSLVVVLTDQQSSEHTFVGTYGDGPEIPYPAGLDQAITHTDALFIQGYTLSEKRMVPLAFRAVERAAAAHVPIYLDVGPFMAFVSPEDRAHIIEQVSVILMTEEEISLAADGRAGSDAVDYLLSHGPRALVVKQGPEGCTVMTRNSQEHVSGFRVSVVDTVGAGDCFDAAFVAGHLNGLSLWECGRLANAMGAATVQRMGAGRNAPAYSDVMEILRQAGEHINLDR